MIITSCITPSNFLRSGTKRRPAHHHTYSFGGIALGWIDVVPHKEFGSEGAPASKCGEIVLFDSSETICEPCPTWPPKSTPEVLLRCFFISPPDRSVRKTNVRILIPQTVFPIIESHCVSMFSSSHVFCSHELVMGKVAVA